MTRDLVFLWEEQAHEALDENKQKVREASLMRDHRLGAFERGGIGLCR